MTADFATPTVWGTADVELTDADGAWAPEELELARPPVAARPPRVDAPPTHGEEQPYVLVLADDSMDAHFHDEETEEQAARTGATLVTLGLDALRPRAPDGAAGAAPRVEPARSVEVPRVEPAR
ncbi:hypothetical protein L6R52_37315, partial [Myxococcota bacterium]|nr:hypothetical protein [Myxococcota bacterium]